MGKMTTARQAVTLKEAPKKPCHDCPWARAATPGWLALWSAHRWLALAHGEGSSECHATKGPNNDRFPCAGLAIYRANVCKVPRAGERLPADTGLVFSGPEEFASHHGEEFDLMRMLNEGIEEEP